MNTILRLLPVLPLVTLVGCYGDKVFVEDGAGGNSTSTSGGTAPTGGSGNGGNGASGGEAPGGGGEGPTGCTTPRECPNPSSTCIIATCEAMTCGEENRLPGDACRGDFGDGYCDGRGACVQCLTNDDCVSPATCNGTHECVSPQCSNDNLDAGETDIDCGGTMCPPCQNTDSCVLPSDCASGYCNNSFVCAPCVDNNQCDTITQYCDSGTCAAKQPNGSGCFNNGECQNGQCVQTSIGGICCNSGCMGTCMSCAMVDTGAPNGICANITIDTDPMNECPTQQCRTGLCGANGCGISPLGTACIDGLFCNGTDSCTTTGTCGVHSGDPCTGPACNDACNETTDACNLLQVAGSPCDVDMDGTNGMCSTSGACLQD